MNLERLYDILSQTTVQLRKGEEAETRTDGPVKVTEVFAMPHQDQITAAEVVKVDLEFLVVGVDKLAAEKWRDDLLLLLAEYPHPDRLASGPSYIEVGGEIGDQGAAFQLFALGKVLGLWDIITPSKMGITGDRAREMAGSGFIMITGWRKEEVCLGGTECTPENSR